MENCHLGEMPRQPSHPNKAGRAGLIRGNKSQDRFILKKAIKFTSELRTEPQRLRDLRRIYICKAVGGQHFVELVRELA